MTVIQVVSEGPVYVCLYCVALLRHLETRLLQHSTQHSLLYNILEEPIQGFSLTNHLDYLLQLEQIHGSVLRADIESLEII